MLITAGLLLLVFLTAAWVNSLSGRVRRLEARQRRAESMATIDHDRLSDLAPSSLGGGDRRAALPAAAGDDED